MSLTAALTATLEALLNQAILLDPETPARLAPMHGKVIRLELLGMGTSLYLIPNPSGIQILNRFEDQADCTLRGSPLDLMRMRGTRESADQLFKGSVEIEGDSALAHQFGALLADLEIDWEEQLSRFSGDVAAHEIGKLARSAISWGRSVNKTTEQNLQEYLQEELRLLPARNEIASFLDEVDRLRDDTERLEARLERLKQRLDNEDRAS
ncbi:MAG: SCP2 sterol-binding domain-containing protein [Candidatus Thiodiazotropha sp.]|jgi:ubiquinone biosynthesis protein UbiJ